MLINRRSLLLTGAAAGLGAALSTSAFAAAPLAGVQAPGFYRRKVGSLEITALLDAIQATPEERKVAMRAAGG